MADFEQSFRWNGDSGQVQLAGGQCDVGDLVGAQDLVDLLLQCKAVKGREEEAGNGDFVAGADHCDRGVQILKVSVEHNQCLGFCKLRHFCLVHHERSCVGRQEERNNVVSLVIREHHCAVTTTSDDGDGARDVAGGTF